jgi:DNA topoisomerase-2
MQNLDEDIVSLFTKRAYDIAGVTSSKVKVFLNGKLIDIKDFEAYSDLYL